MNGNSVTTDYLAFDRMLDVLKPETFEPNIEDVIRALPKINRFNGQTLFPYSVAQHSIVCVEVAQAQHDIFDEGLLLCVLLHDAGEAYIGDIVRPIKHRLNGELKEIEESILYRLLTGLGQISLATLETFRSKEFQQTLAEIDLRVAVTEADKLTALNRVILPDIPRYHDCYLRIEEEHWLTVERQFRGVYNFLSREAK